VGKRLVALAGGSQVVVVALGRKYIWDFYGPFGKQILIFYIQVGRVW